MKGKLAGFALFAAICLALTVFIGADILNFETGGTYRLSATFADVSGLERGDPVKLAGVPVGQVTSLHLVNGQAVVDLKVRSSMRVPTDTSVAVRWRNLIGQRYLSLVPGHATTMLADGAHIATTTSVVDLGAVINQLGPLVGQISPEQLNEIFTALDQALSGNEVNATNLVADLNGILGTLAQRNSVISGLLSDYATISGTVATRDQQIQTMVDNLATLSQSFADNTQLLDNSLTQLSGLSTGLNQLLTTSGSQLHTVVDNLAILTGILHAHVGQLEDALHNLPPALQALFAATSRGRFLDVDLICGSLAPTCQYPIVLSAPTGTVNGSPLDSASSFRSLLLGN
jgi:phospholipid/cholesterol/gamma-HCH transport system substrate-binding protein